HQDVVVVESNAVTAMEVQEQIDCLVIRGNGSSQETLEQAGADKADLFIAVTSSDAVNVLSAHAAAKIGSARRIARVEDPQLRAGAAALGVDLLIDPGDATARDLELLVRQRGVSEVREFAGGSLELVGGRINADAPAAGMALADLRQQMTEWSWLVAAIVRDGETIIARGGTRLLPGDHVVIMVEADQANSALDMLGLHLEPARKVTILGATRVAELTAKRLCQRGLQVILVDQDPERVRRIATENPRVVAICGDPTDPKLFHSEGLENSDAALALTGWDEINILGSLVAKAVGIPTAVSRFHRLDLVSLLAGVGIDGAVSSRLSAANEILRFVRRGRIHSVVTFQDSDAEALEVEVEETSSLIGETLRDLHLPHDMIVGGIVRDERAFVPRGLDSIEAGDRLIIIALPGAIHLVGELSS
ncbi:MAG: Trk system potassium transporter TrkA, partial [bacterium]|nr:Trk system potassium transporter TrkA [bacterium]